MRKIISLIIGVVTLLVGSCTHNNGDIGFWFGTWQLTEISVDGQKQEDYGKNMFFKFQANVCDIITVRPHNEYRQFFAEFKPQGNGTIIIDCGHTSGTDNFHDYDFEMPEGLAFIKGENLLKYHKINNREVTLTFDNGGQTIIYTLKKQ